MKRHCLPLLLLGFLHLPIPAQQGGQVAVITHAGGAHLDAYFSALAQTEEATAVVLADPDGAFVELARRTLGEKLRAEYGSHEELFAREQPAMALISVEARLAPPIISAALAAGAHVLAEKPACVAADDFAVLAEQAEAKGLHLMLALANRVNPEVLEAKRAVAAGELGRIYAVEMHLIQDQTRLTRPEYHSTWFADKARAGGGHLAWLGIHWLDLAMYLMGSEIAAVTGFAENLGGQPLNIEDAVAMAMRFENGALGTLSSGYYLEKGSETHLKIWGSKGWLLIESGPPAALTLYDGSEARTTPRPPEFSPYTDFIRAAVRASVGEAPPPITSRESLRALQAVFGLYAAAAGERHQELE